MGDIRDVNALVHLLFDHYKYVRLLEPDTKQANAHADATFQPMCVPTTGAASYFANAMFESREMHRVVSGCVKEKLKAFHDRTIQILSGVVRGLKAPANNIVATIDNHYGLFDATTGSWMHMPQTKSRKPYKYGWDGERFVDVSLCFNNEGKLVKSNVSGRFSVCQDTILMNDETIYENLKHEDPLAIDLPFLDESVLVQAVAGCGKTYEIVHNHRLFNGNDGDLVLASGKSAIEEIRKRVQKLHGKVQNRTIESRYQTIDSFLMYPQRTKGNVDTLWIDEACMRHFGDILWCAVLSGCKRIRMYGDVKQIPYINRMSLKYSLKFAVVSDALDHLKSEVRNLTRRCPQDVAVLLNKYSIYHPGTITTTNATDFSISVRNIKGTADLKSSQFLNYHFLTYTQADKADLERVFPKDRVSTVHEFQGNESDYICLVKLQQKVDIFNNLNHFVTAVTRHRKRFVYAYKYSDSCHLTDKLLSFHPSKPEMQEVLSLRAGYVKHGSQTICLLRL